MLRVKGLGSDSRDSGLSLGFRVSGFRVSAFGYEGPRFDTLAAILPKLPAS